MDYDQFWRSAPQKQKERMKNDGKKKPDPIRVNARLGCRADKEIHPRSRPTNTISSLPTSLWNVNEQKTVLITSC